jgi:hypothetical protein
MEINECNSSELHLFLWRKNMAATRLIALHMNKGRTLAKCLKDRTDYEMNPDKTELGHGLLDKIQR